MTNVPKRLGVKIALKREPEIQPAEILPIFQRWIQDHSVAGMLIDVIDYKHVPEGPGVILIADEGDYAYDLGDGQTGLHYIRKRALPDNLRDALRLTFHHALQAARVLEAEAPGDIEFDYSSAKISFFDRLQFRNEPAIYDEIKGELQDILSDMYGTTVEISRRYDDQRRLLTVSATLKSAEVDVDAICRRLSQSQATA